MLQTVLAVALCAQLPEPPTDEQVRAALPTSAVDVSISKTPQASADGAVWACVAFYAEVVDGQRHLRVRTVYLEGRKDFPPKDAPPGRDWNTPVMPKPSPHRR
jgi:hypothetical protein